MAKKSYTALLQDFNDAAIGEPETMVQQPVSAEYEKDIEAIRSGVIDKYHDEIKDLIGKDEHRKTLLGYVETVFEKSSHNMPLRITWNGSIRTSLNLRLSISTSMTRTLRK